MSCFLHRMTWTYDGRTETGVCAGCDRTTVRHWIRDAEGGGHWEVPRPLVAGEEAMSHDKVSIADAARLTGVPASTIRRWIAEGDITGVGKPARVSVSEVAGVRNLLAERAKRTRYGQGRAG